MLQTVKDTFKKFDYFMLLLMMILGAVSFFAIYSAVYEPSTGEVQYFPFKQLRIFILGLGVYLVTAFIGYKRITKYALPLYILGCLTLVAVLLKGEVGMGAQRWISIGPVSIQPSEMFKWVWVVMIAWIFADLEPHSMGLLRLLKKFIWVLPPFLLVFLQPDLGTALTYLAVWGIVVAFLGVRTYIVGLLIIALLVMTPIMWGHLKDYQKMRVITFLSPDKDPSGSGYQAIQSRIAIGSGGLTGKGYLKGTQVHLRFMPERHTDFIFSVINEEFGFAGGSFVIVIFLILIVRIIYIGMCLKEAKGKVLCIAAAGLILFQFYVNVSMTLGIAPVVGVPLPFISYGGSSLLTFVAILGLVNSVFIAKSEDEQ